MSMSNFRLSLLNAPQTEITEKWNEQKVMMPCRKLDMTINRNPKC